MFDVLFYIFVNMSRLIYTIDSRNCVFLEIIKAYFHISDEDMHLHIIYCMMRY